MADLLELSSRIIDSGTRFNHVSRIRQELSEVADSIAIVESWSHSIALRTGAGLIVNPPHLPPQEYRKEQGR